MYSMGSRCSACVNVDLGNVTERSRPLRGSDAVTRLVLDALEAEGGVVSGEDRLAVRVATKVLGTHGPPSEVQT